MTNDLFDFQAFSDNADIQSLARESISHISKIYPIYLMVNYHNGQPLEKENIKFLDMLLDLVNQYDLDITLVVNEQDAQTFHEYDTCNSFRYLIHSCYDSTNELSNNIAKIKNFILKSAASRFGNRNINWVFLLEDGVRFNRIIKSKLAECDTSEQLFLCLGIWQYLTTKKVRSAINDENEIGLTGIRNPSGTESNQDFGIDESLISSAYLVNLSECNRKHIEFDLMNDVLEDIDFNVNMFANGLHVVTMSWPLSISKTSTEYRSNRKLSNLAINVWAKWGDKVVKTFMVDNNKIKPIFVSDFSNIIEEFNASSRHRIYWPKDEKLLVEYMIQKKKIHQN